MSKTYHLVFVLFIAMFTDFQNEMDQSRASSMISIERAVIHNQKFAFFLLVGGVVRHLRGDSKSL